MADVGRTLLRAMLASASGAALSGLLSVAAAKILAVGAGPSAVASLQTLQQARQTAVIAATANGQTAIVQGVSALEGGERSRYLRTSVSIVTVFTALVALLLWIAPAWFLERSGLASIGTPTAWLMVAVALTSVYLFLTALLNALGKVEALAMLQVAGPLTMALCAWPSVALMRGQASPRIGVLVAASAAVAAAAALAVTGRFREPLGNWMIPGTAWFDGRSARRFFSISTAMLVTGFVASAVTVLVRGNIVRAQGLSETGMFDAAWSISMNQVTLVLASVQTYYLPRLARAQTAEEKAHEVSRVLIAAVLVAAPVIAVIALAKPLVLHLLYSNSFLEAQRYLRWTLLGDYLKVSSWILSVPMLAAADMRIFLTSDLTVVAVFAGASHALLKWMSPAEGAAAAFLLMYLTHLALGFLYLRYRQIRLSRRALLVWLAGLALVGSASWFAWQGSVS